MSTTGYISPKVAQQPPPGGALVMQGSMGCAAAIELGVATAGPDDMTVIDGDGALIMRLGTLALIGAAGPSGFVHIVLCDDVYASTGRQPSLSPVDDRSGRTNFVSRLRSL